MNCGQIKMLFTLNNFQEAIETRIKVCKDHGPLCAWMYLSESQKTDITYKY